MRLSRRQRRASDGAAVQAAAHGGWRILFTSFALRDVAIEHQRLVAQGVPCQPPTDTRAITTTAFDARCGNLIQMPAEKS